MNVIDFRIRPPHASLTELEIFPRPEEERTKSFGWFAPLSKSIRQRDMSIFHQELDNVNVKHAVVWGREVTGRHEVSTKTSDIASLVAESNGRFSGLHGVGLPAAGTTPDVLAAMRDALDMPGIIGITVDAQTASAPQPLPDDPRYYPVYELCAERGALLAMTMSRGTEVSDNILYPHPASLDRVASDFPDLDIVVSHACWPWVVQGIGVAFRQPNVYLLPDLYGLGMPGSHEWVRAANTFMPRQLLFGSAYPRLGVEEVVHGYDDLPFSDDGPREMVMYGNAKRLLAKHGVNLD